MNGDRYEGIEDNGRGQWGKGGRGLTPDVPVRACCGGDVGERDLGVACGARLGESEAGDGRLTPGGRACLYLLGERLSLGFEVGRRAGKHCLHHNTEDERDVRCCDLHRECCGVRLSVQ